MNNLYQIGQKASLDYLRALIERGQLKPIVAKVFPLTEVAQAHKLLEQGGIASKVAIQVVNQ